MDIKCKKCGRRQHKEPEKTEEKVKTKPTEEKVKTKPTEEKVKTKPTEEKVEIYALMGQWRPDKKEKMAYYALKKEDLIIGFWKDQGFWKESITSFNVPKDSDEFLLASKNSKAKAIQ